MFLLTLAKRRLLSSPGNGKRVWHIVEELIQLNVLPFPANPFEIDFRQVAELPQTERLLMTGALAAFLRELLQQKFSYTELGARWLLCAGQS